MAHNLQITDNVAHFFDARTDAWHRLGQTGAGVQTGADALKLAYANDRNVHKTPLTTTVITETGVQTIEVPGKFATVGTNALTGAAEVYGVVGERYQPVQDETCAAMVDYLMGESDAHIETAGLLNNGARFFISAKIPSAKISIAGDEIENYLIVSNSHDGSDSLRAFISSIRPVCANTVGAAIRGASASHTMRHTTNVHSRIDDAREALSMVSAYTARFTEYLSAMHSVPMRDADFENFMLALYGVKDRADVSTRKARQLDTLESLWHHSHTLQDTAGTRLGAYNALTEYTSHFSDSHGKTPEDRAYNRTLKDTFDDRLRTKALSLLTV